jgi:hypothetical protein
LSHSASPQCSFYGNNTFKNSTWAHIWHSIELKNALIWSVFFESSPCIIAHDLCLWNCFQSLNQVSGFICTDANNREVHHNF